MPMVLSLRNPVAEDDHVSLFRNLGFLLSAVQLSTSVSLFRRMLTTDKLQCVLSPIFREIPMDYISFFPLIPKWHYHLCPGSAWRFSPSSLCPWYFFSQTLLLYFWMSTCPTKPDSEIISSWHASSFMLFLHLWRESLSDISYLFSAVP